MYQYGENDKEIILLAERNKAYDHHRTAIFLAVHTSVNLFQEKLCHIRLLSYVQRYCPPLRSQRTRRNFSLPAVSLSLFSLSLSLSLNSLSLRLVNAAILVEEEWREPCKRDALSMQQRSKLFTCRYAHYTQQGKNITIKNF